MHPHPLTHDPTEWGQAEERLAYWPGEAPDLPVLSRMFLPYQELSLLCPQLAHSRVVGAGQGASPVYEFIAACYGYYP